MIDNKNGSGLHTHTFTQTTHAHELLSFVAAVTTKKEEGINIVKIGGEWRLRWQRRGVMVRMDINRLE